MNEAAPEKAPAGQPLAGTLVVDLTRHLPGPLAARLLGDLGARVIKVEEPTLGDPVRHAPPLHEGRSSLASILLSGSESLALDLARDAGRKALERLLERADVLLESFRPGTLARLGLDPEVLRQRFPRLVICSITGWGQDGPHAHRAGHDLSYQALAGSLAATGLMPAVPVADVVGAWSAALATVAALVRRDRIGEGSHVDQALLDAAAHANLTAWAAEADGPKATGEPLMLTGALPCYRLYRTRDGGLLALALLEPKFWRRFVEAVGCDDLAGGQFSTDPETERRLTQIVAERTREQWAELMAVHDLPAESVLSAAEARSHPQMLHRALLAEDAGGSVRLRYPARIDNERPGGRGRYPELGEDTSELVEEFALAPELLSILRSWRGIGRRNGPRGWLARLAARTAVWLSSRGSS